MAAVTIRNGIEQDGAVAAGQDFLLSQDRVGHGQRVVSIDALGVHLLRVQGGADAGEHVKSHGFATRLSAHAVEVVVEIDDQRQTAAIRLCPQLPVLTHRGQTQPLPHGTAGRGRVTDVADDKAGFVVHLLVECRAHRDIRRAPHDGVVRIDAKGREEGVHRSCHTFVESRLPAQNLGQGPVEQISYGQILHRTLGVFLHHAKSRAIRVGLHDLHQTRVVQCVDRRQSLGQNLPVTAMAAVDVVVEAQMKRLTDRRRLLPDRQVGRPVMSARNAPVGVVELDLIQHGLKAANQDHVSLHPKQILGAVSVPFLSDGFAVLIHRYGGERDEAAFSQLHRIKHLGFGHYSPPVIPGAMSGDSQITRLPARHTYYSTLACPYGFKKWWQVVSSRYSGQSSQFPVCPPTLKPMAYGLHLPWEFLRDFWLFASTGEHRETSLHGETISSGGRL